MVAVLAAWLRPGLRFLFPAMRDYLVARTVATSLAAAMVDWPWRLPVSKLAWDWIYFCGFWFSDFVLIFLLARAAGAALRMVLQPVAGLQALGVLAYRWLLVAIALFMLPAAARVAIDIPRADFSDILYRFMTGFSTAQLLPLGFVMAAAWKFRLPLRHRIFGMLLGLSCEPLMDVAIPWWSQGDVIWSSRNLIHEFGTYAGLTTWLVYLLLPAARNQSASAPSARILQWNEMANWSLRHGSLRFRRKKRAEEPLAPRRLRRLG